MSLQLGHDKESAKAAFANSQQLDVDESLASIRSHRSNKGEDQDDVPFSVTEWSPAWSDVATDGEVAGAHEGHLLHWLAYQEPLVTSHCTDVLKYFLQDMPYLTCFSRYACTNAVASFDQAVSAGAMQLSDYVVNRPC